MTLVRWRPAALSSARDAASFHDEMNQMFDNVFRGGSSHGNGNVEGLLAPAVDIEETPEGFVIRADLPGVNQNDVKVSLMGNTLTIRGERRHQSTDKEGNFHRTERSHGTFERSFKLGVGVRNDAVKAQYKDGVLEIQVPKAEEARMREIEVEVGQ